MSNKSTEMIGMDRCFRPVHVGDTVQDLHGERYAVTDRGTCKGSDGKEVNFSDIHAPELVLPADAAPGQPREAAAATETQTKRHAYDEPKLGTPGRKAQREPQEAPETAENAAPVRSARKKAEEPEKAAPAITRRVYRGRENKSGLVRLSKLAQYVGYAGGRPTAIAREAGFEIIKDKNGQPCVKLQDREAVEELLAKQACPDEKVPTSGEILEKALKKQKEVVVPPCVVAIEADRFEDVLVHNDLIPLVELKKSVGLEVGTFVNGRLRDAGIECIKVPGKNGLWIRREDADRAAEVVRPRPKPAKLPEVEINPFDDASVISAEEAAMLEGLIQPVEIDLQPASDEALVAELRRRGWSVTCEKHITI